MKRISQLAVLFLIPAIALPVAAQKKNSKAKDPQSTTAAAPAQASTPAGMPLANDVSYVIGPSDELSVSVWEQPELSKAVPVRPDGKISLPSIFLSALS